MIWLNLNLPQMKVCSYRVSFTYVFVICVGHQLHFTHKKTLLLLLLYVHVATVNFTAAENQKKTHFYSFICVCANLFRIVHLNAKKK